MSDTSPDSMSQGSMSKKNEDIQRMSEEVQTISKTLGKKEEGVEELKYNLINKAKKLMKSISKKDIIDKCKKSYIEGMLEADKISGDDFDKWLKILLDRPRVILNTLNFYLYILINNILK